MERTADDDSADGLGRNLTKLQGVLRRKSQRGELRPVLTGLRGTGAKRSCQREMQTSSL